ncbi:MAG TPA: DUF3536 domain-containing protein, partial [Methanoregula sp.]|nr:DUF3536 domain-containing protein [Methanoregula sp.]
ASRILDADRNIIDIVNNYASISFNFGPTLLVWLEQKNPEIYAAILEADRQSMQRFSGHGSAIAQVYNHLIMPLANSRDKRTQVIWGIADFMHRFGRRPEGMWLAETAVDLETLEILAGEGILFTILSPTQASRIRKTGGKDWITVNPGTLDTSMPYICTLPEGKSIAIFFYDDKIAQELAFGPLLKNGEVFAERMMDYFTRNRKDSGILSVASDGETYGHHHRFADMALAYALYSIQEKSPATITIFGEYLALHPPGYEVEIHENTSWSCPHGIERWRSDCGCCTHGTTILDDEAHPRRSPPLRRPTGPTASCHLPSNQKWRGPLRETMNQLRDELIGIYEDGMKQYVNDPWAARDDYIAVILDRSPSSYDRFFARQASRAFSDKEKITVLKFLEMQRHSLLMFTSCGWFFEDISGIESIQVMRYACRAMQLAREISGINFEPAYMASLGTAKSNNPDMVDGATIYLNYVQKSMIDFNRIAFNHALSGLITGRTGPCTIRNFTTTGETSRRAAAGDLRIITGIMTLRSEITGEQQVLEYAVLHLGNYDFMGGVRPRTTDTAFSRMQELLETTLGNRNIGLLVRTMEQEFSGATYSLWHLFRDAQRELFFRLMESTLGDLESSSRQVYRQHITLVHAMKERQIPVPRILEDQVWYILNVDLDRALRNEPVNRQLVRHLISEIILGHFLPDRGTLQFTASGVLTSHSRKMAAAPGDISVMQEIVDIFTILSPLTLEYELWECQNNYFHTGKKLAAAMEKRADEGDAHAREWVAVFRQIGTWLGVKCLCLR